MPGTYVLLHGAFHGGWCWARVAELLRRVGDRVYAVTQTGAGERRHLLNPFVDLETYVEDVIGVIEAEELTDVVLVGHSFGGRVISGVADRIPVALRHLVYLDATIPLPGRGSSRSGVSPESWAERLKTVVELNGVPCFSPPPPEHFGVTDPADVVWVRRRLTPMPVSLLEASLQLRYPVGNGVPATYVRCTAPPHDVMEVPERYAREQGWAVHRLATGHDAMISMPEGVVDLLRALPGGLHSTARSPEGEEGGSGRC